MRARATARPRRSPSSPSRTWRWYAPLYIFAHLVGENIHRPAMSLTSLECQVSELVNSDACPCPTTGRRGDGRQQVRVHRRAVALGARALPPRLADGAARARPHCRVVLPLIHFTSDVLTYSMPLFLRRQCDQTLGAARGLPPSLRAGAQVYGAADDVKLRGPAHGHAQGGRDAGFRGLT